MSEPAAAGAGVGAGGGVAGGVAAGAAAGAVVSLPVIEAEPPAASVPFFLQPAMDTSESAATSAIEVFFIRYLR
jgi:hypothetical protein